ncbi:SIR2 family protein [Micromonospora chersina]|uniref:SIR2 family protein n=1 Tax=Micromonospora chersina TaxID=47854 RepID=UPI003676A8CA
MMTLDEAINWLESDVPCLVFAGAGVSVSAPAGAPGVGVALDATLGVLASLAGPLSDDTAAAVADVWKRMLPESCYGSIAAAAGTADHLRLWESYAWTATPDEPGPHPNAGHSLLAWLAHRHRLPVVTTNFDCFLEEAVLRQGLRPVVGLPDRRNRFDAVLAAEGEVAIWKLHGSARRIDTIRSQAADLARSSHRALKRGLPRRPERLLILGYSGRDFDVFPWLADLAATADTLWIDRKFGPDHRARTVPTCTRLELSFEEVAQHFWRTPSADQQRGRWREAIEAAVTRPVAETDETGRQFATRVEMATVTHLGLALRGDRGLAALSLASALSTAADFSTALQVLEAGALGPAEHVRSRLLRFFALESMDRHRDAETCAAAARLQAWSDRDVLAFGRAEIALVYARIRRFIGTIREPDLPRPRLRFDRPLRAAVRLLADVVLLAPLFAVAAIYLRRRTEERRHYDALDFACDYLEHTIRTGALISIVVERLPGSLGRWPLQAMWHAISAAGSAVGYMRGVINIRKYLARLVGSDAPVMDAVVAASLVGDSMAEAIASRDSALAMLKRTDPLGADGREPRATAERELHKALHLATVAGNPSMKLKVLLVMNRHDMPLPVTREDIETIVGSMQGEADEAIASALAARLINGTTTRSVKPRRSAERSSSARPTNHA